VGFINRKRRNANFSALNPEKAEIFTEQTFWGNVEELNLPLSIADSRDRTLYEFRLLLRNVAPILLACSASTWSCINAISGDTTTVNPGFRLAGKHRDFPPPVGMTTSKSDFECLFNYLLSRAKTVIAKMIFERLF